MIKKLSWLILGICFFGYAWMLHIVARLTVFQVKLWLIIGSLFIVIGIYRYIFEYKNIQIAVPLCIRTSLYTTIVLFTGLFLSVGAWLAGNAYREPTAGLNYLIVTWDNFDSNDSQTTQSRSYHKAIAYLQKYHQTILMVPGEMNQEAVLQPDTNIVQYLSANDISTERVIVIPKTSTLKQNIREAVKYIKLDWYNTDDTRIRAPKIGLVTDGIYTKNYELYGEKFEADLISVPSAVAWWYLPQLTIDEIRDYVIYHVEDAF